MEEAVEQLVFVGLVELVVLVDLESGQAGNCPVVEGSPT